MEDNNMKKTYSKPETRLTIVSVQAHLLGLSSVGNEYKSTDVTYSRGGSDWDDDEE